MHKRWLARKYRLALDPELKKQLELKVLAESLFKGKTFGIIIKIIVKTIVYNFINSNPHIS